MLEPTNFFNSNTGLLLPAIVSAVVTIVVASIIRWAEVWRSADVAYRFEQKKRIKEALGRHIGTLLDTAEKVDGRLENLSGNYSEGWLIAVRPPGKSGYYFVSTIQRLMCFYEVVYRIEQEAIVLDARYADRRDFEFLNFVAIFRWILSDIDGLFRGFSYNRNVEYDHVYADNLKEISARFSKISDRDRESEAMQSFLLGESNEALVNLVEGLRPGEQRKRWDRFIALHLLLATFQDSFGYKRHLRTIHKFRTIASRIENLAVLENLVRIVSSYALADSSSAQKLISALSSEYRSRTGSYLDNNQ